MPAVGDAAVRKHFFVASYVRPEDGSPNPYGSLATVDNHMYGDIEEAKTRAKLLAAQAPSTYHVVYEAMWYAWTDLIPVNIRRVGAAVVG